MAGQIRELIAHINQCGDIGQAEGAILFAPRPDIAPYLAGEFQRNRIDYTEVLYAPTGEMILYVADASRDRLLALSPELRNLPNGLASLEPALRETEARVPWNRQFDAQLELTADNRASRRGYNDLKAAFINDFDRVTADHPEFRPKIRFNDARRIVEIGHGYNELLAILPQQNAVGQFILKESSPYLPVSDRRVADWEGKTEITPLRVEYLTKAGEEQPFALNAQHANFSHLVSEAMSRPPQRTYPRLPEPDSANSTVIRQWASQAQQARLPLRLFVGENHKEVAARRLILQAMPAIRKAGATLCLEHFFYESQQSTLDQWILGTPPGTPMPFELEAYARNLDREYGLGREETGFLDLLQSAKEHGVRVVALDTEAVRARPSDNHYGNRVENMNYVASQIIAKEVGHGAFVGLVGNTHCGTLYEPPRAYLSESWTPGLDTLCNAASLTVQEGKNIPITISQGKVLSDSYNGKQVNADYFFEADRKDLLTPVPPSLEALLAEKQNDGDIRPLQTSKGTTIGIGGTPEELYRIGRMLEEKGIETVQKVSKDGAHYLRVRSADTQKAINLLGNGGRWTARVQQGGQVHGQEGPTHRR